MNTIDQSTPPDPSGVSFWPLVLRYGAIWGGVIADGAGFVWLCVGAAALGAVGTVLAAFEPRQSDTDKTGG